MREPGKLADSVEVTEVIEFLGRCIPFDRLEPELLALAGRAVTVRYFRQGSGDEGIDRAHPKLYVVRSGAFEIRNADDELVDRVDEGGLFGFPSLLTGNPITAHLVVLEDGLVYQIDEATFRRLRAESREFDRFFNRAHARRLGDANGFRAKNDPLIQQIGAFLRRRPVTVESQVSVREVATVMTRERISSILVVDAGRLVGIVTDRDLRARVVQEGRGGETPVGAVMTASPVTIEPDAYLFEAMMQMSEHNIHHLPVAEGATPVGIITTTDIVRAQKSDPVFLISEISRQRSVEGLQRTSRDVPELFRNLVAMEAGADEVGRVATTVSDAFTRQLIRQAQEELGEPPVDFVWLAFGSQARREQTAHTDQDNALLLADTVRPEDDAYFQSLATHVCDGLDACGYAHCRGGIMASNPRWRRSLTSWRELFLRWIREPSTEALMHSSIFFDLRPVHGSRELLETLRAAILEATSRNDIFLACLAENALKLTPPLGFFRQFVLERNGDHAPGLDLKHRGVVPIIDIARLYALAAGIPSVNTMERLARVADTELLTAEDARELRDAYEYIANLRVRHQGAQLARGEEPDNYLQPDQLSDLVRHQLRDAFELVNNAQAAVKLKFTGHL